jgi:hypothetical protein
LKYFGAISKVRLSDVLEHRNSTVKCNFANFRTAKKQDTLKGLNAKSSSYGSSENAIEKDLLDSTEGDFRAMLFPLYQEINPY